MAAFFGFHMPTFTFPGVPSDRLFDRVAENAKAAEKAGFDLVTVMDHFYQISGIGPETEPMMEAYTTLSALATQTSRVKLGTLVTGVTYRNPALLVKQVTTLDVISKGRAIFGIGAAWNEVEHRGYGIEFPPIARRMDRLGEALTIAKLMFTQDRPSFEGTYYKIDRALNVPRPIQPGGPKILIGGGGERRTLRLLAEHGDIGHWFGGNLEDLKRKKKVFEEHCAAVNRDPSEVLLTVGLTLVLAENEKDAKALLEGLTPERRAIAKTATVSQAAEVIGEYMEAGFGGFTFNN
ncbi:MAG TPA: LLM class F420-dependent oxidoreductase, partial [Candidatus Dormibacteraeota bacterium]